MLCFIFSTFQSPDGGALNKTDIRVVRIIKNVHKRHTFSGKTYSMSIYKLTNVLIKICRTRSTQTISKCNSLSSTTEHLESCETTVCARSLVYSLVLISVSSGEATKCEEGGGTFLAYTFLVQHHSQICRSQSVCRRHHILTYI